MGQKFSNVETFLVILTLFAMLTIGMMYLGKDAIDNPNSNLDNDSVEYISNLVGVEDANLNDSIALYKSTRNEQEKSILISDNISQGNPKDYALDFLFAKEKGFSIELIAKRIYDLPQYLIVDLLRYDLGDWEWFINIIVWFLVVIIIIAVVYFARAVPRT